MWIDTHCHLDAPEYGAELSSILLERSWAREAGVGLCVYPAVERANWERVRELAHATGDAYALGIHPLYVPAASDADLQALEQVLHQQGNDPRLVAVGEIGLDFFVPELCAPGMREKQRHFYDAQLRLAQAHGLPVILHVRRSVDALLQGLRAMASTGRPVSGGIAHAFNGSSIQAKAFVNLGFKLGFGGALTFDTALRLRRLATELPQEALVLETDAPDIPPQWLYVSAAERASGRLQGRNSPRELPRIGAVMAGMRGWTADQMARVSSVNACVALPRLAALMPKSVA